MGRGGIPGCGGSCRIEIYNRGRGSTGWWDWNYIEQPPIEGASLPCVSDTMTWSVWVKSTREWTPPGRNPVFRLIVIVFPEQMDGSLPHYKEFVKYCVPNTEWQQFTVDWCRPYEDNRYIFCKIEFADTGTLWIDNATITRKGATPVVAPPVRQEPARTGAMTAVPAWMFDTRGRAVPD